MKTNTNIKNDFDHAIIMQATPSDTGRKAAQRKRHYQRASSNKRRAKGYSYSHNVTLLKGSMRMLQHDPCLCNKVKKDPRAGGRRVRQDAGLTAGGTRERDTEGGRGL